MISWGGYTFVRTDQDIGWNARGRRELWWVKGDYGMEIMRELILDSRSNVSGKLGYDRGYARKACCAPRDAGRDIENLSPCVTRISRDYNK